MARTKRKLKTRSRRHVRRVLKARKRRIGAAGAKRCAATRTARRLRKRTS